MLAALLLGAALAAGTLDADPPNPRIDMAAYLAVANEAAHQRASHRLDVAAFDRLRRAPGSVLLDARSAEKFARAHIEGAINLPFPDIDLASLAQVLPDKDARILIYCNNNFANLEHAFPRKRLDASLNLSTYIALYSYGYRNVYELGPLLDARDPGLPMAGSDYPALR